MRAGLLTSWRAGVLKRWPNRCAVCRTDSAGGAGRLCSDCLERHAPVTMRCPRCALRAPRADLACGICLRAPPPWTHAVAACDYAYPWDGLLGAFKFEEALDLAAALAGQLGACVRASPLPPVDVLLPVPLSTGRLRERGYNQAAVLATATARTLGLRCETRWLLKLVDTPHQFALPRARRIANVRGVFAVEPLALHGLRDLHVALVDDVMTTGATCAELTRVLLAAGVASVQIWVIARTPKD